MHLKIIVDSYTEFLILNIKAYACLLAGKPTNIEPIKPGTHNPHNYTISVYGI